MRIRAGHVFEAALYASDLDAMAEFYGRVFGLDVISRFGGRGLALRCGGTALLVFDPARTREDEEMVPKHGASGAGHVAFLATAEDLPRWQEHLAACGVPIEREVTWPAGGMSIYVRDPAGNSVELAPPTLWGGLGFATAPKRGPLRRAPSFLETARLVLRRPRAADAQAIFERYASDPEATRYLSWPTHTDLEDTRAFVAFSDAEWERWPAGPYLIESRASGALLGGTGLAFETTYRAATGYVLASDAWGHGFATEALEAIVTLAPTLGVRRLHAICHVGHRASERVLQKGGFAREGVMRRHTVFPNLESATLCNVFSYGRVFAGD